MTRYGWRRLVAITVTLVVALTGCGSRLPYGKVLAENAALGGNADQSTTGNTSTGASPGSNSTSGGTGAGHSTVGTLSPSGSSSSQSAGASHGSTAGNATAVGALAGAGGTGSQQSSGGSGSTAGGSTAGGGTSSGPATLSVLNVGQIGTDSGIIGDFLGQARQGADIWANYVNQHGGLNGHKVNLITADDGGDPTTALSEAKTMVQQDHVIAFVQNANLLSTPAVAPYLESVGVPAVGGIGVETQWYTNRDLYPNGANLRVLVDGGTKVGIDKGDTSVGVVACVEFALICSNITNILQHDTASLGGHLVYDSSVSIAQPDFTSQCLGAKAAGVNTLWLALDPASDARLAIDCANQNYHPQYVTQGLAMVPSVLTTPNTVGMVSAAGQFPFMGKTPATAQFDQAVQQATGAPPDAEWDATAWVSGLILETATKGTPAIRASRPPT